MARFEPFAGLRYDTEVVALSAVIAPPYDVVGPSERGRLASRSPYNSILLELPEPDETAGLDRYAHAATLLESWRARGVLREERAPTVYVYRMSYVAEDGRARSTTGVVGALGLDSEGEGEVLPHEQTMPRPKGDRLDLLRACRANLSPIWGLSLSTGLARACAEVAERAPAAEAARDDDGVLHELWPVADPATIAAVAERVEASPVVLADGHHRYETASLYQAERRRANGGAPGAYDLVMAFVVELCEDELVVEPIHRLVSGLPADLDLAGALGEHFELAPGPADPVELQEAMTLERALGLVTADGNLLLRPRPSLLEEAEADLDSSRLDVALAGLPAHEVSYLHGARDAARAVASGAAQHAYLLRPATVAQIAETAHSGRRMPPKTTFFQPKPRTGIVLRPVPG